MAHDSWAMSHAILKLLTLLIGSHIRGGFSLIHDKNTA